MPRRASRNSCCLSGIHLLKASEAVGGSPRWDHHLLVLLDQKLCWKPAAPRKPNTIRSSRRPSSHIAIKSSITGTRVILERKTRFIIYDNFSGGIWWKKSPPVCGLQFLLSRFALVCNLEPSFACNTSGYLLSIYFWWILQTWNCLANFGPDAQTLCLAAAGVLYFGEGASLGFLHCPGVQTVVPLSFRLSMTRGTTSACPSRALMRLTGTVILSSAFRM